MSIGVVVGIVRGKGMSGVLVGKGRSGGSGR